jgi:hypothetical protein
LFGQTAEVLAHDLTHARIERRQLVSA